MINADDPKLGNDNEIEDKKAFIVISRWRGFPSNNATEICSVHSTWERAHSEKNRLTTKRGNSIGIIYEVIERKMDDAPTPE